MAVVEHLVAAVAVEDDHPNIDDSEEEVVVEGVHILEVAVRFAVVDRDNIVVLMMMLTNSDCYQTHHMEQID
jgi:2-phosphoglycerate kinase